MGVLSDISVKEFCCCWGRGDRTVGPMGPAENYVAQQLLYGT